MELFGRQELAVVAVDAVGTLDHDYFAHHIVHYTSGCRLLVAGHMFHTGDIVADHGTGIPRVSAHIVHTEGNLRIAGRTDQGEKLPHQAGKSLRQGEEKVLEVVCYSDSHFRSVGRVHPPMSPGCGPPSWDGRKDTTNRGRL